MTSLSLPVIQAPSEAKAVLPVQVGSKTARAYARHVREKCLPRSRHFNMAGGIYPKLFVVNSGTLHDIDTDLATELENALSSSDETVIEALLARHDFNCAPMPNAAVPSAPPIHALSLAVAQSCNLGCSYCYAEQGNFGGPAKNMSLDTAKKAVDLLLCDVNAKAKVNLAFLGGEPMINRKVLRAVTEYAAEKAEERGILIGFSITTNGTLLQADDAPFFERHAFAVTVSLDGTGDTHDRLRPMKGGGGSYDRIIRRIEPMLKLQRQMQVSARVTVTPWNLNLPQTLRSLIDLGFHSVGFSPLLTSTSGSLELDSEGLSHMLESMIDCGLAFEQHVLRGERFPFLNMVNALRELHMRTRRAYPCGAGLGYLGVSADGDLAACHRFVNDDKGVMGNLSQGVDRSSQQQWLKSRHLNAQRPCQACWARYLCSGGCHHEVLAKGRVACDFIRGWLHYALEAYSRLSRLTPDWFTGQKSVL